MYGTADCRPSIIGFSSSYRYRDGVETFKLDMDKSKGKMTLEFMAKPGAKKVTIRELQFNVTLSNWESVPMINCPEVKFQYLP